MWRKSIFTALALALAWGLGNALHEIWLSAKSTPPQPGSPLPPTIRIPRIAGHSYFTSG
jgi:hypothetical protein